MWRAANGETLACLTQVTELSPKKTALIASGSPFTRRASIACLTSAGDLLPCRR